jgi:hypothetical protein
VGALDANLRVEVLDQAIPRRYAVHQAAPEPLVLAAIELIDRHSLLFHPRVIAEIEDALAVDVGELEDVIVDDAFK